jgi:uncharacterized membrane protein YbhN (UPF0104 family)
MSASITYVGWRILGDSDAREVLGSVPAIAVVGLIALQAIYLLPQAYRYLLALRQATSRTIPVLGWYRLFILGRFLNSLIPQGGSVYRGLRLKEDYGVPVAQYLGAFVAFTWLTTVLNLVAASVVIGVAEPDLRIGDVLALVVTLAALAAVTIGPIFFHWSLRRLHLEKGFWGWANRRLSELLSATTAVVRSPATLAQFVVVGLVGLGIAIALFGVAFDALDLDASLSTVVVFFVLLQLSTYVNITPGNLGLMELGFGALGSQLGIGLVGGLLVAALIRVSGYSALLLTGFAIGGRAALASIRSQDP